MEPTEAKMRMLTLPLGKFRVVERTGNTIKIALHPPYAMMVILPDIADVRVGDLLTFYTDVPYANPQPTSVQ